MSARRNATNEPTPYMVWTWALANSRTGALQMSEAYYHSREAAIEEVSTELAHRMAVVLGTPVEFGVEFEQTGPYAYQGASWKLGVDEDYEGDLDTDARIDGIEARSIFVWGLFNAGQRN